jgi:peptide deformylase
MLNACMKSGITSREQIPKFMPVRNIINYPDPFLKQVVNEISAEELSSSYEEIKCLIDDMFETMYVAKGIGLAAPQVKVDRRIIVIDTSDRDDKNLKIEPTYLINPKIIEQSGSCSFEEGCLSIPGYRQHVKRNSEIAVSYRNLAWEEKFLHASDLTAVCLQHEIDHLNGILFIDRLSFLKRELFHKWHKKNNS